MSQSGFGQTLRRVLRRIESRPTGEPGDAALLARFAAQRDEAAFATLVQRYGSLVLGVCRRVLHDPHDAEDAFQAVFLVLARKAGSLDGRRPLGSWFYTVARNLALKHRAAAARRRTLESNARARTPTEPRDELLWREVSDVLDAELGRLAENHRAPLVLCHLQGLTHEAAARALGWPTGSLARRLARGQELLRERLADRGLHLSTAGLLTLVAERGTAAVPPAAAAATTQAALQFAAGQAVASPTAVALAGGALKAMTAAKLRIAAVLLLGIGLLAAGAGISLIANPAATPAQAQASANENPGSADEEDPADQLREILEQRVNLDKGIDAGTPLQDALDFFSDRYDLTIRVDETAFADAGVREVGAMPVSLPRMVGVRLETVLRFLASQLAAPHGLVGSLRIQGNKIVIAPRDPSEPGDGWLSPRIRQRLLRPVAWDQDLAADTPMPAALDLLAARYGETFRIDEKSLKLLGAASSRDIQFVTMRLAGGQAPLLDILELWCLAVQNQHHALSYRIHSDHIEIGAMRRGAAEVKSRASVRGLLRDLNERQRQTADHARRWENEICTEFRLDANTPLKDALEFFSDRYDLTIIIDTVAFEMAGLPKIEEHLVELPLQRKVQAVEIMRQILKQIDRGDWTAACLVRENYLEITPLHKHVQRNKPLTREQLDGLWDELAHEQWLYPLRAAGVLARFPAQVVPLLAERVRPAPPHDPARLAEAGAWVKKLDSDDFAVRQQATEELEKLGPLALPALREQLAARPTLEVRQRVEILLRKLTSRPSSDQLRILRAIRILEVIATPEAERVLHGLAQGAAGAPQTEEARAAILRSFQ